MLCDSRLSLTAEEKAAGASSAVAEVTPPAVDESANQGDLPEQSAARPAPGSAAKAPHLNQMWEDFVPDEDPWPAGEAMIPPQNCKAPPHIRRVETIAGSHGRSTRS